MPDNHYYVVAWHRRTGDWRQSIEVRPSLQERVLMDAGIEPGWGEIELSDDQVRTLAAIMDFTPDFERYSYTFDTVPDVTG